jgi:predicted dehydrogenase
MMAAQPRTVIVCGTGSIGMRHLRVLREHLGIEPVALPARAERVSAVALSGFRAVGALADVPAGPVATIVATDTARHLADALRLLPMGPVLVEKPLAPSAFGLSALEAAVQSTGHPLYVAFCFRFDPGLQDLREQLHELGTLQTVRIECQSFLPDWRPAGDYRQSYSARAEEGGVLRDLAHELDYAVWLFGRPTAVFAMLGPGDTLGIEADAAADLLWHVPRGPVVSIRLDYLTRQPRRLLRVTGSNGEAEWDALTQTVAVSVRGRAREEHVVSSSRDSVLARQTEAFLRCSKGADSAPLASLDEAAFIVALSDAARRSGTTGSLEVIQDWRTA